MCVREVLRFMKKLAIRKWLLIGGTVLIIVLGAVFAVLYRDYSNSHLVTRLGKYRGLTVDAGGKEAEDAVAEAVAAKTRFGRKFDKELEKAVEDAMKVFTAEAEYLEQDMATYLREKYNMTEEEFRSKVERTTREELEISAVLHAIAEKEKITFSDEELDRVMPYLMEAYGYIDETQFAREVDLEQIRDELLLEKVAAYLVTQNTVVNAKTSETE